MLGAFSGTLTNTAELRAGTTIDLDSLGGGALVNVANLTAGGPITLSAGDPAGGEAGNTGNLTSAGRLTTLDGVSMAAFGSLDLRGAIVSPNTVTLVARGEGPLLPGATVRLDLDAGSSPVFVEIFGGRAEGTLRAGRLDVIGDRRSAGLRGSLGGDVSPAASLRATAFDTRAPAGSYLFNGCPFGVACSPVVDNGPLIRLFNQSLPINLILADITAGVASTSNLARFNLVLPPSRPRSRVTACRRRQA